MNNKKTPLEELEALENLLAQDDMEYHRASAISRIIERLKLNFTHMGNERKADLIKSDKQV